MNSKYVNFLLIGFLAALCVGIFGSAYGINSLLEDKSHKLVDLKSKLAALQQEQTQLAKVKKDIVTYNNLYKISKIVVPQSKDQTETVRQIIKLAALNNVNIAEINFPSSSLGTSKASTSQGVSAAPAGGTAVSPSTAASASGSAIALSQLTPLPKIPGLYVLAINVYSSNDPNQLATYPQLIGFLSSLEQNRLTAQVSQVSIIPSTNNPSRLAFNLLLNVYIKPDKKS